MADPDYKTKLDFLLEKYSPAEVAVMLGISERSITNYSKGYTSPQQKIIRKISEIYNKENGNSKSYIEQRRELKSNDEPFLVPFVDIPAQAGYSKAYQQRDYIATLRKYPILPDVDPAGAVWRYFQVDGDSMENPNPKDGEDEGIRAGDTILASQVPKEDWNQFANLYTYVVVTDENLWIKDVDRQMFEDESLWVLISRNQEHLPFTVSVKDVRQLWVMRRHIRNRAKKHRLYDLNEIRKKLKH